MKNNKKRNIFVRSTIFYHHSYYYYYSLECGPTYAAKKDKNVYKVASMAEWSKAVDLSPTISGCAGSNPAWRIFFSYSY